MKEWIYLGPLRYLMGQVLAEFPSSWVTGGLGDILNISSGEIESVCISKGQLQQRGRSWVISHLIFLVPAGFFSPHTHAPEPPSPPKRLDALGRPGSPALGLLSP